MNFSYTPWVESVTMSQQNVIKLDKLITNKYADQNCWSNLYFVAPQVSDELCSFLKAY